MEHEGENNISEEGVSIDAKFLFVLRRGKNWQLKLSGVRNWTTVSFDTSCL